MQKLVPIRHAELVAKLRRAGFDGPLMGGKHLFMIRGDRRLILPNPHRGDISVALLQRLLRQAGIERDEWLKL
jgi:predicted RNA binding protein YcfA (HicA-like mRNA interferase family)